MQERGVGDKAAIRNDFIMQYRKRADEPPLTAVASLTGLCMASAIMPGRCAKLRVVQQGRQRMLVCSKPTCLMHAMQISLEDEGIARVCMSNCSLAWSRTDPEQPRTPLNAACLTDTTPKRAAWMCIVATHLSN